MTEGKEKIDWSQKRWKEMLVYQRKFAWAEDTLDKLAVWMDLKPGLTVVDVGCGLGFLGYTFWPYFGAGGQYLGIDLSLKLLKDTVQAAAEWGENGNKYFLSGDSYHLPLADNCADRVVCQTLLMHLEKPQSTLAEMVRITKPGGRVTCFEPDNLSSMLKKRYSSIPELDLEDYLLCAKVILISYQGAVKLGRGDNSIGPKIPQMMSELGMQDIKARINDRVFLMVPPYADEKQQHSYENVKKNMSDQRYYFQLERTKEEFLAGGGDPDDFIRYEEIGDELRPIIVQQLENKEFFSCGCHDMYVISGRKPQQE